jgi:hypothetical protein
VHRSYLLTFVRGKVSIDWEAVIHYVLDSTAKHCRPSNTNVRSDTVLSTIGPVILTYALMSSAIGLAGLMYAL